MKNPLFCFASTGFVNLSVGENLCARKLLFMMWSFAFFGFTQNFKVIILVAETED